MTRDSSPALRLGVLCAGTTLERWQAECIEHVLAVRGIEVAALIVDEAPQGLHATTSDGSALSRTHALWRLYAKRFVLPRLRMSELVDFSARISGIPRIELRTDGRSKLPTAAHVEQVRLCRLDAILSFVDDSTARVLQHAVRFGVWTYDHGDPDRFLGSNASFWEIDGGESVTVISLHRLTADAARHVVLHQGWFKTVPKSYVRSRENAYAGSVGFAARVCRDLIANGDEFIGSCPTVMGRTFRGAPSNAGLARFAARELAHKIADATKYLLRHDQWNIGIVDAPIERFLDPEFKPGVRWLPRQPRGRIAADPFAIRFNGSTGIVYESLDDREQRGRIFATMVPDEGEPMPPREVIEAPVHLSYPYLVEDGGVLYCVPEMAQSGQLQLFRSVEFPWRWQRTATLLHDVKVLDASIFRHDGFWWILGAIKGTGDAMELHGWYAEALAGPWHAHACNPLKTDVRGARPGGTPFFHQGALYRPAQDLSRSYGGRLVIQRVESLTPTRFSEQTAGAVEPSTEWLYKAGLHTLSAAGNKTVIDAKRTYFSPPECWRQIKKMTRVSARVVRTHNPATS
jgi:hypothetical protein